MPLISDSLSVWEIAHRWAGYDPDEFRLKLPLLVKDYFKLLVNEVLQGHLFCETLIHAKRPPDSNADAQYYIRHHQEDLLMCVWGKRYKRKLLKWAIITRHDFEEWCGRFSITPPEFWFPTGWNREFDWPESGPRALWAYHIEPDEPGGVGYGFDPLGSGTSEVQQDVTSVQSIEILKHNQQSKLVAQRIAAILWKEFPDRNISEMARDETLLKYADATRYTEGAIVGWLREVAPVNIRGKRGRPRNKPATDAD